MRWRLMPLMMLIVALAHFNRISITVAGAEEIIPSGAISKTQMGWVYTAFLLTYTLCMTPGGLFIDRFGPQLAWIVMGLGLAFFSALTGLAGLTFTSAATLLITLLLVRLLMGILGAPLHPTGARLVANWLPGSKANRGNGLLNGAALFGIASTYVLFGLLIDRLDWPGAFLFTSAVTLLVTAIWALLSSDYPRGVKIARPVRAAISQEHGQLRKFLRNRSLVLLTIGYGLIGYFQYLFFYWAEFYFEKGLELSTDKSRAYSSILTVVMGVGMMRGGWLSDCCLSRFGLRRGLAIVPIIGLMLSAVAVAIGVNVSNTIAIVTCLAIAMGTVGLSEGSYWTAAVTLGGYRAGTAAAILNTGGNAIGALAPVLTPYISEKWGWQVAVGAAGGVRIVAAALWLWIDPTECVDDEIVTPSAPASAP